MTPCSFCAMMIVNAGIKRVVCEKDYHSADKETLIRAGVQLDLLDENVEDYGGQAQTRNN